MYQEMRGSAIVKERKIFYTIGGREMITLEQYEQIRRMYHVEEQSERAIARSLRISRQTVNKALHAEHPPEYTLKQPRPAPRLGAYKARLDELLAENAHLPKKQRYTAHKLFTLIQAEGYQGSEASVQMYGVHWRKAHRRPETFLPLEFDPGQDAQTDWVRRVGAYEIPV